MGGGSAQRGCVREREREGSEGQRSSQGRRCEMRMERPRIVRVCVGGRVEGEGGWRCELKGRSRPGAWVVQRRWQSETGTRRSQRA